MSWVTMERRLNDPAWRLKRLPATDGVRRILLARDAQKDPTMRAYLMGLAHRASRLPLRVAPGRERVYLELGPGASYGYARQGRAILGRLVARGLLGRKAKSEVSHIITREMQKGAA